MDLLKSIHWIHHSCFRIKINDITIYFDPWKIKNPIKADFIFITHDHYDHFSMSDIESIADEKTTIILPDNIAGELSGYKIKKVKQGDVFNVGNIKVEVVPAYNVNKNFHKKSDNKVGYVLEIDGNRIYHAGDTDLIPEMKTFKNINIAFLPVSGTYVMTAEEAVKAALDIKPDIAIPMHYGTIIGTRMNAEKFAEELRGKIEVVILKEE